MNVFYAVERETKEMKVWTESSLAQSWEAWSGDFAFITSK